MTFENWNDKILSKPVVMPQFHPLDDIRSLQTRIEQKAHDLFKGKPGQAPLQVTRIFRERSEKYEQKEATWVVIKNDVDDLSCVKALSNDSLQIFTIRHDRSWTTLNISREMFENFMSAQNIMPSFWKHVFTFGRKAEENEFQFPGFCHRRTGRNHNDFIYECAYILRRVKQNHQVATEGRSPWSIRQTAVYHKFSPSRRSSSIISEEDDEKVATKSKSMFLLIAPSGNVECQFAQHLDQSSSDNVIPWNVHRILVADSLRGWMDYMASMEEHLKEQASPSGKENLSPLIDFNINFEDRQELKIVEDSVLDLQAILPGMLCAIVAIQEQCKHHRHNSRITEEEKYDADAIIYEFDEYIREVRMHIERVKVLKDKAKSTAELLSDLLSYEEAVALKDLTRETQVESKAMCGLTERSTKYAAAVKILTVITLVYLPTTIVAVSYSLPHKYTNLTSGKNFFSTQLVQTQDDGYLKVSKNAWLLAEISIPLTFLTILLWWGVVHFTKVAPIVSLEQPRVVTFQYQNNFWSFVSKKRQRKGDLESEQSSLRTPTFHPPSFHDPTTSTRSSMATNVKPE
ncbi:uncharacterized protein PAC_18025 [Phialocephala subalpina]|uniref:CorA-like transporter domain-containing protein n=1 Tax=Phialocephala subalpina TaxID=576137 RepID=A0A1L7XSW5_9HELO|nr:uncharacterized protein PAC_18025 [Phialocephala subalpina]